MNRFTVIYLCFISVFLNIMVIVFQFFYVLLTLMFCVLLIDRQTAIFLSIRSLRLCNFIYYLHRYGRVNYVLAKRLELLSLVGRLQSTLEAGGDAGATCELAHHFHVYHVRPRWEAFREKCAAAPVSLLLHMEGSHNWRLMRPFCVIRVGLIFTNSLS